jgi:hypothetical protein
MKSTNSTICVVAFNIDGIHFYNSNDFHLIRNYSHYLGRISQINSIFYEFNHKSQTLSCYDENANLKKRITLKGLDKFIKRILDGAFINHNGALVIQSYSEKKVIKLFFK